MKKIITFLLLLSSFSYSQVEFSSAFKQTVETIAKEHTRKAVINWLTEQDPVLGIIGRDLIGQIINSADQDELVYSVTDVLTTSLFIYNLQNYIKPLLKDNPQIVEQAKAIGWTEQQLLAYSSLYFYFSERIKYDLYITPYIFELQNEKDKVELLTINNKKWRTMVSRELVVQRQAGHADIDVRIFNIFQASIIHYISSGELKFAISDSILNKLKKEYLGEIDWLKAIKSGSVKHISAVTLALLYKNLNKDKKKSNGFGIEQINDLVRPYLNLVSENNLLTLRQTEFKRQAMQVVKTSFSKWLDKYQSDQFRFDYSFMLASNYISRDDKIRFIMQDQVRFGYFWKDASLFLYLSGVIDPLLQEAFSDDKKYYLSGLGYSHSNFNISVGAAVPYTNFKKKNIRATIILGYELPLIDYIDSGM
ncbi:MAG: hypothetical protein D8M58_04680 [Calditrichaeota bacterium]|nr:MAG: hypothetical protein DWQ03_02395 [Calditrichota bacterium]MBL1204667.1 hypothetical protein [Calditrichota bacterium]NOG44495.1 hypothetical protein [Calditrichota bacterium]